MPAFGIYFCSTRLQGLFSIHMKRDTWVYAVVVIWAAIWFAATWQQYLSSLAWYALLLLPVMAFAWFRQELKAKLSWWLYIAAWLTVFAGYGFLIVTATGGKTEVGAVFIVCFWLDLVLEANVYVRHYQGFRKINLDAAILLGMVLLTGLGSAMAVSGIGDPRFDNNGLLLIGGVFSPEKIMDNFPLFLGFWLQFFLLWLTGFIIYYINHYFLVPRLLKERGIVYYAAGVAGTVVILYPVLAQLIIWLPFNQRFQIISTQPFDPENAWAVFAVLIGTLPVIVAIHWFRQHSRIATLEKQQVQAELDVLKQQINPHFFFNTLNNLYALSLTRSAKTPEVILQLSELMRYVIYEGQKDQVQLSAEVKYMEDYLHLQKIRMHKYVDVQLDHEGHDPSLQISPLLLIILIENAFKHGVEPAEGASFLHLKLQTKKDEVYFSCKNSVELSEKETTKGIGLENLRRRLQLLYPGRHTLHTETDGHTFFASLKLQLHATASPHH